MNSKGAFIAVAVAGLFGCASGGGANKQSAPAPTGTTTAAVHCAGINSCKGSGACKGAENACKGQNACKGKGWVDAASTDECTAKGGTVAAN